MTEKVNLDFTSVGDALVRSMKKNKLLKRQIKALSEVICESGSGRINGCFGYDIVWENTTTYGECELTVYD